MADEIPEKYQDGSLLTSTIQGITDTGERRNLRVKDFGDTVGLLFRLVDENGIPDSSITEVCSLQIQILNELKKMNLHLSKMTDEFFQDRDIGG